MMTLWNVFDKAGRLRNLIYKSRLKPISKFNSWPDRNQVVLKYLSGYVRVFFHVPGKNLEPYCDSCGLNKCSHILDAIVSLENDETIQNMNPFVKERFLGLLDDYLARFEDSKRDTIFHLNTARGDSARDIVRSLLEAAGYKVQLFGQENILCPLPQGGGASFDKLKSMPDLVVNAELVEVKFRNSHPQRFSLKNSKVKRMFRYWPEAFLVAVIPNGKVFYVARIADLKEKMGHDHPHAYESARQNKNNFYYNELDMIFDLTKAPWKPIEEVFIKIKQNITLDDLEIFRDIVKVMLGKP